MSTNFKTTKNELIQFLDNQQDGLFAICSAKKIDDYSHEQRCDAGNWGPAAAIKNIDSRFNLIFGSEIVKDVNQLEEYRTLYDFSPYGYLIYIKLRFSGAPGTHDLESEKFLLNQQNPPLGAKSIGNLFKLIIEWAKVKDYPWDNVEDPASEVCSKFLETTKMPQEIINYIESNYQDMQIYRYLKGSTDARNQEQVNNQIDAGTLNWFYGILPEE